MPTLPQGNADRTNAPAIVEALLSVDEKSQLDNADLDSCIPLHLLNAKAELLEESNEIGRENVLSCIKIYFESKPKIRSDFLVGIRNMPEWLSDEAVIHPTVQTMLNTKITSRYVAVHHHFYNDSIVSLSFVYCLADFLP